MNNVVSLVVVFCTIVINSNCKADTPFDIIYGLDDGKLVRTKTDQPNNIEDVVKFSDPITALARYKNYLFVAKENHWPSFLNADSLIYRCSFHWGNLTTNNSGFCYDVFDEVRLFNEHITSLALAKDWLFAGRTDGIMWRCSIQKKGTCETLAKAPSSINGIAYDSQSNKIFASLENGTLWRCSPNTTNSCENLYNYGSKLTDVHVTSDAVWIGAGNGPLLKCPMAEINNGKALCGIFDQPDQTLISKPAPMKISSKNGSIYVPMIGRGKHYMWKCDPDTPESCANVFALPKATRSFLIVDEN